VLTIGWGHTNHHGREFDKNARWTQQDCDDALEEDMQGFGEQVAGLVKVPLKQNQFDALVSFAYNVGIGNMKKSTLLRKLNDGDDEGAALEFHRWNRSNGKVLQGLVRRRAAEALLFQGIADLDFDGNTDRMPQLVGVR
jgi:lysozyme